MSFCADCFKGVRHQGTPTGKIEQIGGVNCYVATPSTDYPKHKALIYLYDAFGLALENNLLLCDDFASNGLLTIAPDYFEGEPIPIDAFNAQGLRPDFDMTAWRSKHGPEQCHPFVIKVINALKEQGVNDFAAVGYCYGARFVFDLAFENITKVSAVAHPSLLKVPDDLEKYASDSKAPLLINGAAVDSQFPPESQAKADEILGDGKFAPGYRREYFDGCTHGFAVRGDMSDPKVKAGKEGAFKATVEWFWKHL
ncbi:hypothetical protein APHAL10511_002230 [Amanita phalloides]|nr:hypothetical protein APHAL10511_002230 [Amanita phalloides]